VVVETAEDPSARTLSFDPVWLILRRPRPNLDPPRFLAPGELSIRGHSAEFGPSEATLVWPTARRSDVRLDMDRIVGVRRKRYGWGAAPRFVEISYETADGIVVAYFNDGAWHGWRPMLTGSNRRIVNQIRQCVGIA
jgi:hypothetical protein